MYYKAELLLIWQMEMDLSVTELNQNISYLLLISNFGLEKDLFFLLLKH